YREDHHASARTHRCDPSTSEWDDSAHDVLHERNPPGCRVRPAYPSRRTQGTREETRHTTHRKPCGQVRARKVQRPISGKHANADHGETKGLGSNSRATSEAGSGN